MTVNELIEELSKYSEKFGTYDTTICGLDIKRVSIGNSNTIDIHTCQEPTTFRSVISTLKDAIRDIEDGIGGVESAIYDLEGVHNNE